MLERPQAVHGRPVCNTCGDRMSRARRALIERLLYLSIHECKKCKTRTVEHCPWIPQFAHRPHCPRCGTQRLKARPERDRIDPMTKSAVNLIHRAFGGGVYFCGRCRLQFYHVSKITSKR